MQRILAVLLGLATVSLATFSHAQETERSWDVTNNMTTSTEMTNPRFGGASVSCGANTELRVKCKNDSDDSWQPPAQGGSLSLTCGATDPGMQYQNRIDTDVPFDIAWNCEVGQTQNVTISGELSNCRHINFSYTSSCQG